MPKYKVGDKVWRKSYDNASCECCKRSFAYSRKVIELTIEEVHTSSLGEGHLDVTYHMDKGSVMEESWLHPSEKEAIEAMETSPNDPPKICSHCQDYFEKEDRALRLACKEVVSDELIQLTVKDYESDPVSAWMRYFRELANDGH